MKKPDPGPMASPDVARTSLVVFLILIVQHTLLDSVRIDGAHPELMVIVAAASGYIGGPERGAFVGFFTGLAADLLLPTPFGLSALVGCLLGYATGLGTSGLVRGSRWMAVLVFTTATVAGLVGYGVLSALIGQRGALAADLAPALVVATPAAAVLAVPVLALMRWAVPPALPPAAVPPAAGLGR